MTLLKNILLLMLAFSTFFVYSDSNIEYEKEIKEKLLNLYSNIPEESVEEESILLKRMFDEIESNENVNDYKKFLSKSYVIFLVNKIYISEDKEKLTALAKEGIPLSVCFAYQYQSDTSRILNEMVAEILYNDSRIALYNKSAEFLYSEEFMKKLKIFFEQIQNQIPDKCSM